MLSIGMLSIGVAGINSSAIADWRFSIGSSSIDGCLPISEFRSALATVAAVYDRRIGIKSQGRPAPSSRAA
jgi:hypothetical protein